MLARSQRYICLRLFRRRSFLASWGLEKILVRETCVFVETRLSFATTLIPNARQCVRARTRVCAEELLHYYYEKTAHAVRPRLGDNVERPSDWMDSTHLSSILHYFFLIFCWCVCVRTLYSVAVLPSRFVSPLRLQLG